MNPSFGEALDFVLKEEGGYVDDPNDHGGSTNKGVTQAAYDGYRNSTGSGSQSVRYINDAEVYEIYFNRYWIAGKCDQMNFPINLVHMDACVNSGLRAAMKLLQRALDVEDDGVFGKQTIAALAIAKGSGAHMIAQSYMLERVFFYDSLDDNDQSQTKFLTRLWLKRVKHVYKEIKRLSSLTGEDH